MNNPKDMRTMEKIVEADRLIQKNQQEKGYEIIQDLWDNQLIYFEYQNDDYSQWSLANGSTAITSQS